MISNPAAESQWNRPMACHRESSLKKNENRVHLGTNYIPGHNAVICGRGKAFTASPGNKKLRAYIDSFAKSYGWEKIGNLFRDILHTKYRSSSKAKQARKHKVATGSLAFNDDIQSIVTKLSMDRSYSSCGSSSASTILHSNNNASLCKWNMGFGSNHGGRGPSSIGFPSMSSMFFGMRSSCDNFIPPMPQHPFEQRGINYCNQVLNIICTDATLSMSQAEIYRNAAGVGTFSSAVVPFTTSCKNAVATVTHESSSRSFGVKITMSSTKVSEDGDGMEKDDDDDEVSIATFAEDDDIFSDFLLENLKDLSRIF